MINNPEKATKGEKTGLARKIRLFFDENSGGYFQNPIVLWLAAAALLVNVSGWVALAIFIKPVSEDIILHYNVYFGVDLTGHFRQVWFFPVAGLFIFFVNLVLGAFFFKNGERIASYVLLMTSLMANLSLVIAISSVIIINY